jgi:tRNA-dihydrouridine synthase A
MVPYAEQQLLRGGSLRSIARHVLGLYHGQPGGRRFRQMLSDARRLQAGDASLLLEALAAVEGDAVGAAKGGAELAATAGATLED